MFAMLQDQQRKISDINFRFQIALDTTYWTIFNHITIWGSVLTYFVLDYFYNYVIGGPYVGSLTQAMREATFWCTTVITVLALMVPVMASRFYFIDVKPSLADKVRDWNLHIPWWMAYWLLTFADKDETTTCADQVETKHRRTSHTISTAYTTFTAIWLCVCSSGKNSFCVPCRVGLRY